MTKNQPVPVPAPELLPLALGWLEGTLTWVEDKRRHFWNDGRLRVRVLAAKLICRCPRCSKRHRTAYPLDGGTPLEVITRECACGARFECRPAFEGEQYYERNQFSPRDDRGFWVSLPRRKQAKVSR